MKKLLRLIRAADERFKLFEPGDRVAVGLSGGKDSWALLHLLQAYSLSSRKAFELCPITFHQGLPGFPVREISAFVEGMGLHLTLAEQDLTAWLQKEAKTHSPCSLCARIRRAALHKEARRLNCNSLALGHHREDLIETLLLNLFYAGRIAGMPARMPPEIGGVALIRPLCLCPEEKLAAFTASIGAPVAHCACNYRSGADEIPPDRYRQSVRRVLNELQAQNPNVKGNLLAALQNLYPQTLLQEATDEPIQEL